MSYNDSDQAQRGLEIHSRKIVTEVFFKGLPFIELPPMDPRGDFLLGKKGIEVKCEAKYTGNFCAEYLSDQRSGYPGWMFKYTTDILIDFYADAQVAQVMDFKKLKAKFGIIEKTPTGAWFKTNIEGKYRVSEPKYEQRNSTKFFLVPIKELDDVTLAYYGVVDDKWTKMNFEEWHAYIALKKQH